MIYMSLQKQAAAMSNLDLHVVLDAGAVAMFFLSFLLKSNDPRHTEVPVGH
jgi:hypothetical protein